MSDIIVLLTEIVNSTEKTMLRQLTVIVQAMLAMSGRVTMLGISRWAGKGGSYRTIQRFFNTEIDWQTLFYRFFLKYHSRSDATYILAGDESVITKAGTKTHGLDRFYAGLFNKPVPGIAIFALSLINVSTRQSHPIQIEQVVRTEAEKEVAKAKAKKQASKKTKKGHAKPGRPKGSKNKIKTDVTLTPELKRIQEMLKKQLSLLENTLPVTYVALDGHFGNNNALQMVRQCNLHLISKLRYDSELYLPYIGKNNRKKYSERLNYRDLPARFLKAERIEGDRHTRIYQLTALHRRFAETLNIVIITKINTKTDAFANVILFSSDLDLAYDKLVDYYRLRFQIEFNFRDAKQYWGLEDFMNIEERPLTNALNLSLFMVSVSQVLLTEYRQSIPNAGVLDLKSYYRANKYFAEMIKMLPKKPEPNLLSLIFSAVVSIGRIHPVKTPLLSP